MMKSMPTHPLQPELDALDAAIADASELFTKAGQQFSADLSRLKAEREAVVSQIERDLGSNPSPDPTLASTNPSPDVSTPAPPSEPVGGVAEPTAASVAPHQEQDASRGNPDERKLS
jgi:hypothetical protein